MVAASRAHLALAAIGALLGTLACLTLAACGGTAQDCDWPRYDGSAAVQPSSSAPHADFAQLRPRHRYSHVTREGAHGHHFAVTYRCIEPFLLSVAATEPRVGRAEWTVEAGWWGGVAVTDGRRAERIPNQVEDLADELRDRIEAETDADDIEISYLGAYRELEVEELIPTQGSQLSYGVLRAESGFGLFCYDGCVSPPYWIAETPESHSHWPLLREGSTATVQALPGAWRGAMLAAARDFEQGDSRLALTDLAGMDDRILPDDLDQVLGVSWTIHARPVGSASTQDSAALTLLAATNRLAFSREEQRVEGDVQLAGVTFHLQIRLRPDDSLPARGSGSSPLTVAMDVLIDDDRGNHAEGQMILQGDVLYDDGRAASIALTPTTDPRGPASMGHPYQFELPGTAGVAQFDVYPDPQLQMVPGP